MELRRPRRTLLIVLLTFILVLAIAVPIALNSYIFHSIDLKDMRSRIIAAVKSHTGLVMTVQGVNYRFLRGIVFTGVKIHSGTQDSRGYLLQAENILLEISVVRALKGGNPFSGLKIPEGKLNPWALKPGEWDRVFNRLSGRTAPGADKPENKDLKKPGTPVAPAGDAALDQLQVRAPGMRIAIPEKIILALGDKNLRRKLYMDLSAVPGAGTYEMAVILRNGAEQPPTIRFRGNWKTREARKMNFRFSDIPAGFAANLMRASPALPAEIGHLAAGIRVGSGTLAGRGSMDSYPTHFGLNFLGNFQGLTARAGPGETGIELRKADGEFNYNIAYREFTRGPVHAKFQLTHEDLKFAFDFKNLKEKKRGKKSAEKSPHYLNLSGNMHLRSPLPETNAALLKLPGVRVRGRLDFNLRLEYEAKWMSPIFLTRFKDVVIHPTDEIFKRNAAVKKPDSKTAGTARGEPRIHIAEMRIEQKRAQPDLKISARGVIRGGGDSSSEVQAPFTVKGGGPGSVYLRAGTSNPELNLRHKLKINVEIGKLPYRTLLLPLARIHDRVIRAGSARDAPRAEDHGPIRRYRYLNTTFEQIFMDYTDYTVYFTLKDMQPAGAGLPSELKATFWKTKQYVSFSLDEVKAEKGGAEFLYTVFLRRPMPVHEMKFEAFLKDNQMPFPELLGTPKPPRALDIKYSFNGQGFLPHDIIQRTYSTMTFFLQGADCSRLGPSRILRHRLKLSNGSFAECSLYFYRSTNGNSFKYSNIQYKSPELELRGTGSYGPGQGGDFGLKYQKQVGDKKDSGNVYLRLLNNGTWAPGAGL